MTDSCGATSWSYSARLHIVILEPVLLTEQFAVEQWGFPGRSLTQLVIVSGYVSFS